MSRWKKLAGWFGKAGVVTPKEPRQPQQFDDAIDFQIAAFAESLRSRAPTYKTQNALRLAAGFHGQVYNCVDFKASQVASAEFTIYERVGGLDRDGKRALPHVHPMYRLFENPNPTDTFAELLYAASVQLDLTGEAILWAPRYDQDGGGDGFEPQELYVLPTATLNAMPRSARYPDGGYWATPFYLMNNFAGYPTQRGSGGVAIPMDQIVRVFNRHPYLGREGYSLLTAISRNVDTLTNIDQARSSKMVNDINAGSVLELPGELDPDGPEMKRIRQEFYKVYGGAQNAGKQMILTNGAKLNAGTAPKDMEFEKGWQQLQAWVASVVRTPLPLLGMVDNVTFATLYATIKLFYTQHLQPHLNKFSGQLTKSLIHKWVGEDYFCELTPQRVHNDELDMARAKVLADTGVGLNCEIRELLGCDELDSEQYPWVLERVQSKTATTNAVPLNPEPVRDPSMEGEQDRVQKVYEALKPKGWLSAYLRHNDESLATVFDKHLSNGTLSSKS